MENFYIFPFDPLPLVLSLVSLLPSMYPSLRSPVITFTTVAAVVDHVLAAAWSQVVCGGFEEPAGRVFHFGLRFPASSGLPSQSSGLAGALFGMQRHAWCPGCHVLVASAWLALPTGLVSGLLLCSGPVVREMWWWEDVPSVVVLSWVSLRRK